MSKKTVIVVAVLSVIILVLGCGKGMKGEIQDLKTAIDSLKQSGAPDTLLTSVEVLWFKAESEQKRGKGKEARKALDEANVVLKKIEEKFATAASASQEIIDATSSKIKDQAKTLTGERAKIVDSIMVEVQRMVSEKKVLQANTLISELGAKMPELIKNEETAKKIAPKLAGRWKRVYIDKDKDIGSNMTETTVYTFTRNGKFTLDETKKGKYNDYVMMDYKYYSTGDYTLNGDTVKLWTKTIKGFNKNKRAMNKEKTEWKIMQDPPSFDSLVTDGSQDRFTTYSELKQHYKR